MAQMGGKRDGKWRSRVLSCVSVSPHAPLSARPAQFRPEKNHRLQLEAFALAKQGGALPVVSSSSAASTSYDPWAGKAALAAARLKMVGSCRNADDEARLAALKAYAQELGIAGDVDWWGGWACRGAALLLGTWTMGGGLGVQGRGIYVDLDCEGGGWGMGMYAGRCRCKGGTWSVVAGPSAVAGPRTPSL